MLKIFYQTKNSLLDVTYIRVWQSASQNDDECEDAGIFLCPIFNDYSKRVTNIIIIQVTNHHHILFSPHSFVDITKQSEKTLFHGKSYHKNAYSQNTTSTLYFIRPTTALGKSQNTCHCQAHSHPSYYESPS